MNSFRLLWVAPAALLALALACGDDDGGNSATNFSAQLSAANEVPPTTSTATGNADITINGQTIDYEVNVTGLTNAVQGHIHVAPEGESGPVRLNLCGTGDPQPPCTSGTGVLASGSNGTTEGGITFDSLVSAIRAGNAYVNVHTFVQGCTPGAAGCNPDGEIRGQLVAN